MISLVICTFNRPDKINNLIGLILAQTLPPTEIIVVDSSEEENKVLKENFKVIYLKSTHKNQPYQRYLGYLKSNSEYILFLDDDMEPVCQDAINILSTTILDSPELVGIAIYFKDKFVESSLSQIPKTIFPNSGARATFIRGLTGYITLADGKLGYCGLRGNQPKEGGYTEWVSGGAFLAKRSELFINFNFQLFDLFEKRMGMGEDALIGYTLSKRGKILYLPLQLFWHNDSKDSTYSLNPKNFSRKVTYSRLFLSMEVARLSKKSLFFSKLFFYWYTLWRSIGLFLNLLFKCEKQLFKFNMLIGSINGFVNAFSFKFDNSNRKKVYWGNEIANDLLLNKSNFGK